MRRWQKILSALILAAGMNAPVSAVAQEFVASYGNWWVFTVVKDGTQLCYIASAPVGSTGNFSHRDEPHLMVTNRAVNVDEVSAYIGYPLKAGSEVKLEIDGTAYKFFTHEEEAWAYNQAQDEKVVNAMKRGNRVLVRGVSQRDTFSIDTYSLKGISMAYNKMKAICR